MHLTLYYKLLLYFKLFSNVWVLDRQL